ncbi:hypothetical protein CsSME_00005389 [Camellia sinensis var. sinensis]
MFGARGTVGYIAPEVFSKTFGQVSHKSDVYSYGMMVLEMTGARDQKVVVQTSEKYFPHWIYEHLEHEKDLRLHGVVTTTEEEETSVVSVCKHSKHWLSFLGREQARVLWPPEFQPKLPRRCPTDHSPDNTIPSPYN